MLQALKLENAPTPLKIRSETGSDPGESAFAGLMAQASLASRALEVSKPEPRSEERSSSREVATQHQEAPEIQTAAQPKERAGNEKSPVEGPSDSSDPAKAAVTAVREDEATATSTNPTDALQKVTGSATSPATPKGEAEAANALIQTQVPTAAITQLPQSLPIAKPEAQAANPEGQLAAMVVRVEAALKGIPQEIQPSEEVSKTPVKPALTELLYIPKGEIQTLKQTPGSAKALQTDASKLAITGQAETPGDAKAGTDLPEGDVHQAKPPGLEELCLIRSDTSTQPIQNQNHPALPVESAAIAIAEGVKASQTPAHAESSAAVRQSPVFTQVEGSIRWILQNKTQGAELQLHPESLGRMVIQLRVEGREVHARLWASEPTSLAILQDHKAFLEASLREQGLSLGSFDLHSGTRGDGAQTAPQERAIVSVPSTLSPPEVKQEMPSESGLDSAEAHRIEVFA